MKRLLFILMCTTVCTFCGPYTFEAIAQQAPSEAAKLSHEERAARRAERLAEFERTIDSVVMSHNFQFNPQSVEMLPAGSTQFLMNPNYMVTVLRGSVDVCLPYYTGYTPPYRYVLLNTGSPSLTDFVTQQKISVLNSVPDVTTSVSNSSGSFVGANRFTTFPFLSYI